MTDDHPQSMEHPSHDCFALWIKHRGLWLLANGLGLALFCFCIGVAASAQAAENFRFGGFGTFGYAADNQSNIAPARDISYRPANGYQTGATWRMDTRLGVQAEYAINPDLDLVGQLVWRDHFKADAASAIELAYLVFRPRHDLDIRVGRVNYDAVLMSDHRNVGFAYTWARPPVELYGWIPIFSVNGLDAAWNLKDDAGIWRLKAQAGNSSFWIPIGTGYEFSGRSLFNLSLTRQTGPWRIKAAWSQFKSGNEVPAFAPLHAGLDAVSAAGLGPISTEATELRRNLGFKDAQLKSLTLGAAYDDGVWVGQGELSVTRVSAEVIPHGRMAYLSVGRRFGAWTPFVAFAVARPDNDRLASGNDWGGLNASLRDPAYYTVNTTRMDQRTVAIGARWDFDSRAAFKLQLEHTRINPSGYGLWWRALELNLLPRRVDMVSATIDFLF